MGLDELAQQTPSHFRERRFRSEKSRRDFLKLMGLGGAFYAVPGAFAQALTLTPAQIIGPFYPNRMPLDVDNDLLVVQNAIIPAVGVVTWLGGRILDRRGDPIRGAQVEIWQADVNGAYIHTNSTIRNRDAGFQGFGRFITGSSGEYLFRTVKPGLYPGRAPHIHFGVTVPGARTAFVTQLYEAGQPRNNSDSVLNSVRNAAQRALLVVPWTPIAGSAIGEVAVKFDIVMDHTPGEAPVSDSPRISLNGGLVNAASLLPGTVPGSRMFIQGSGFTSGETHEMNPLDIVDGVLPVTLNGVTVLVDDQPAPLLSVSPGRLEIVTPDNVTHPRATVSVSNQLGVSNRETIEVNNRMPALFQETQGHVAATHGDGSRVGPEGILSEVETTPARPGERIAVFATGLGPTDPLSPAGMAITSDPPPNVLDAVTVRINTLVVTPEAARLTKPGLYEIVFTVPSTLLDGDHAIVVEIGGTRTAKIGRLRVRASTGS
jgi:protocatechuate 3,4-dioxygenase, beta subunit